eukprot:6208660-Pleurochrysis_carterae.AAC.1
MNTAHTHQTAREPARPYDADSCVCVGPPVWMRRRAADAASCVGRSACDVAATADTRHLARRASTTDETGDGR